MGEVNKNSLQYSSLLFTMAPLNCIAFRREALRSKVPERPCPYDIISPSIKDRSQRKQSINKISEKLGKMVFLFIS